MGREVGRKESGVLTYKGTGMLGEVNRIGREGVGVVLEIGREIKVGMISSKEERVGTRVRSTGRWLKKIKGGRRKGIRDYRGGLIRREKTRESRETEERRRKWKRKRKGRNSRKIWEYERVTEGIRTGWKSVDTIIPIGWGQRELIIGDRKSGKTTLVEKALKERGRETGMRYKKEKEEGGIYVSVGKKSGEIGRMVKKLKNVKERTTVIVTTAGEGVTRQIIGPMTGTRLTEREVEKGRKVMIVYDDLTKHGVAYRQMTLILRRPVGREAYPGDIFYIHARMLERIYAIKRGGGSTGWPIVETEEGDLTGYIATNIISITDGQIVLDKKKKNRGEEPAISYGLSVTRVGARTQEDKLREVMGKVKLEIVRKKEKGRKARWMRQKKNERVSWCMYSKRKRGSEKSEKKRERTRVQERAGRWPRGYKGRCRKERKKERSLYTRRYKRLGLNS